ncbi:MAG: ATP-binding protein [Sphingobium sp.]
MIRFSLRSLTWTFLLLFLLATALTGVGIYSMTVATIRYLVDQRIAEASHAAAPDGLDDADQIAQHVEHMSQERDTGDLGFSFTDAAGRQLAGNIRISRALPSGYSVVDVNDRIEGLSKGRVLVRELPGGLRLAVLAETEPFNNYDKARIRIYLIGFGSIIAVVLGGLVLFSRMVGHHITSMRATVDRIVAGDLNERIAVTGDGSAFDQQAEAFNHMLDRIQQLMDEIGNVSNDIAHQLRTPLTRLRGKLALMQARGASEAVDAGIGGALEDADQLLAMFNAILRIAEIEGGERRRGFARIDLAGLAEEVHGVMSPVAEDSGHVLSLRLSGRVAILGDAQLLTQLLINLIENALCHTPPGTRIALSAGRSGGHATIMVRDDGPGMTEAERKVALRRFARLGRAGTPGHGLGLPLADAIVRLHGGEMRLEDAAPGLAVLILLPVDGDSL